MLRRDIRAVRRDLENLRPSLAAGVLETDVDILECLGDFAFQILGVDAVEGVSFLVGIPAA